MEEELPMPIVMLAIAPMDGEELPAMFALETILTALMESLTPRHVTALAQPVVDTLEVLVPLAHGLQPTATTTEL